MRGTDGEHKTEVSATASNVAVKEKKLIKMKDLSLLKNRTGPMHIKSVPKLIIRAG